MCIQQLGRLSVLAATSLVLPGGVLVTHDPSAAVVWPKDKPVLHGHLHGLYRVLDNVVDIGVDVWDFYPVELHVALSLCAGVRERRAEVPEIPIRSYVGDEDEGE